MTEVMKCDGCSEELERASSYLELVSEGLLTMSEEPIKKHFHDQACLKKWVNND